MQRKKLLLLTAVLLFSATLQAQSQRKIGELDLPIVGVSATVDPVEPVIPKNIAAGIRIAVSSASGQLTAAEVSKFVGGPFQVRAELSGPGLGETITLPQFDSNAPANPDPLLLLLPPLSVAGDYTLSNLRLLVNGSPALDIVPNTVTVKVIDQVLITSVKTRALTNDEIKAKGIVLDSDDYLGFEFNLGLQLSSKVVNLNFPAIFDRNGVAVPQPILPLPDLARDVDVQMPTIIPVLLQAEDGIELPNQIELPDGRKADLRIPSVLVIPGNVGYLKQFFSAQLLVANGTPAGSNLVVHDVTAKAILPPGADQVLGTSDDPLALPQTERGPQPDTLPVRTVGPDATPDTADDAAVLNPGEQGQAEFLIRGEKEGFHAVNFDIKATLDGLATGPVKITGKASGGVLVRNPYFDISFTVPAVVRKDEHFKVYVTVTNIGQGAANDLHVTLDSSRVAGAHVLGDSTKGVDSIAPGDAKTLEFEFVSERTGQVVASYLHFDTQTGVQGDLKFTLGVGERGIPLSPDTLVLPAAVDNLPTDVVNAAMRVLGQAWSIANAPTGTLPAGVIRTNKSVVTQKALTLAEGGLRVSLGQPLPSALRDLVGDFFGGDPLDPGFDQLLRQTEAGKAFAQTLGNALRQPMLDGGGPLAYEREFAQVAASGSSFISFAVGAGTSAAPVEVRFGTVAQSYDISNVPGGVLVPFGPGGPVMGVVTAPGGAPYTLEVNGTGFGSLDASVTLPRGDGTFVRGTISGVAVSAQSHMRVVVDLARPDILVLQIDANGDGVYEAQQPLALETFSPQGPRFISATVVGPETVAGASPYGVQAALLFDRVVDERTGSSIGNYSIPNNKVLFAKRQLSGRLVFVNLAQPEGPYVPNNFSVSGVADTHGAVGPGGTVSLGARLQSPGAVVSGRVLKADGSPVSGAIVTYVNFTPSDDCQDFDDSIRPVGVSSVPLDDTGGYEFRYVWQHNCGYSFRIASQDPDTGALREVTNRVRSAGEHIVMDIALLGRGAVSGVVKDIAGRPVAGARVTAVSITDPQVGGTTTTDGDGVYRIEGMIVGAIRVTAGKGPGLGSASGRIDRAGTTATVNITLDAGSVTISGTVRKIEGGVTSTVPDALVVYSILSGAFWEPVASAKTDSNGRYVISTIAGKFRLAAYINARDNVELNGDAAANDNLQRDLVIELDAGARGTVGGSVRYPDGSAAGGVVVSVNEQAVLSNADGTYQIAGVAVKPQQPQTLTARSRDGVRAGSTTFFLNSANQTITDANVTLSGVGNAQFLVVNANGTPASSQQVGIVSGFCNSACGCNAKSTDDDGKVTYTNFPLGAVSARAVKVGNGFVDVADATASLLSDGSTGFATLRFNGTGTVTGRVLDPDGRPAFGADILLYSNDFDETYCTLSVQPSHAVQTDSNGYFRFSNVNVGPVRISVTHPFYPAEIGASGTLPQNGTTADFQIKLIATKPASVKGTVYLPDGISTAGSGIEITADGPLPNVTVYTDAEGDYAFAKVLPEGPYTITARDPVTGGVSQEHIYLRSGEEAIHDQKLKERGTVLVRVVDGAGQPVQAAFVRLKETDFPARTYEGTVEPANEGIATFLNVFEGPISVEVTDPFGRGGRTSAVLPSNVDNIEVKVQLTTTGKVAGHFYLPDGTTPIAFGSIRLLSSGKVIGQITTDGVGDVGHFEFDFAPAGDIRLEAQDPLTARTGVGVGVIRSEGEELTIDVLAQGLGTVQGAVLSNGVPQPLAHVEIVSGSFRSSTNADSEGRFVLSGVPEGKIVAIASLSQGFLSGTATATLAGDGSVLQLDVPLRSSGTIRGHLLSADGVTPAPLSTVSVYVGGVGGGSQTVSSNPDGTFVIDRVPSGTASLAVDVLNSFDQGAASVLVPEGQAVDVTIQLNGLGQISGQALDSSGQPTSGSLTIQGTGQFPYSYSLVLGGDGRFIVPEVLAGPFTAKLQANSGVVTLYGTASGTVVPGQTSNIEVRVQDSGTVRGVVLRSDGHTPAIGASVTLQLNQASVTVQAQSDGSFSATGVPLGSLTLRINDPTTAGLGLVQGLSVTTNGQLVDVGTVVLDTTSLSVITADPSDGALNVGINQPIHITFNNQLQGPYGIAVFKGSSQLAANSTLSEDKKTVTLQGTWPDSSDLTLNVSTSVLDYFGRGLAQPLVIHFRTLDTTPASVVSVTPANQSIQVDANSSIVVAFNEPLGSSTDLTSLIVVTNSSGAVVGETVLSSPITATFTPAAPLALNSGYNVTVNGSVDLSGNRQTNSYLSSFFTVDTLPPTLTLTSPTDGSIVSSTRPSISIGAADQLSGLNAQTLSLAIDGQNVLASLSGSAITYAPTSNLADGQHTITATIADRGGNFATLSGSFTVDSGPPSIAQLNGITENQVLSGAVTISGSATDSGSGINRIDVLLDGSVLFGLTAPSFQYNYNTSFLSEGPHTFAARAVDKAGNIGATSAPIDVIVNNRALAVSITSPASGTRFKDIVAVSTSVNEPVQRVEFAFGTQSFTATAVPYQATFDLSGSTDGNQNVVVTAYGFGNETASASVSIVVDRTPPVVNTALIDANPPQNGISNVRGRSAATEAGAQVQITNLANNAVATVTAAGDGSFNSNISGAVGDTLSLVSVDSVGNRSNPVTTVIRSTPPLPQIVQVQPADGSAKVPTNVHVVVRFAEPVSSTSIVSGTLRLLQAANNVTGTVALSSDGLSLTFTPTQSLAGVTVYTVVVQDVAGNQTTPQFQSSFTTDQFRDTTAPTVVKTSPDNAAAGVPVNAPVTVLFSKQMDPASLTTGNFQVRDDQSSQYLAGIVQVDPEGRRASFVANTNLPAGRQIHVFLNAGITDSLGNHLSSQNFYFNTSFSPDTSQPSLIAISPPDQLSGVPTNAQITLQFSEAVGSVGAQRGIQVSTGGVPVSGSIALWNGNANATFTPASAFLPNTTYTIALTPDITDVAGNGLASGVTTTFTTGSGADLVRPSVVSADPANNVGGVATNAVVRVRFSERINPLTVDGASFRIARNSDGLVVPGTLTVAADGLSASWTGALAPSTYYEIRVTPGVRDLAGQSPSGYFFSYFATGTN